MARTLIITNPAAARTSPRAVRTVRAVLRREGWHVDIEKTKHAGHAAELAAEGARAGVDVVAVYGGDGTAMQAVKGMQGHEVPLALIPGGTGNLLAGNLRLPRSPARAALVIARGSPRALDLGRLEREDGSRYFAVACGAGFDAELMASTTAAAKRRWKMGAYIARAWETIGAVRNVPYRVTVDGRRLEGEAATVMVANCSEFMPPLLRFGPDVAVDDGVFDIVILRAEGFLEGAAVLVQWVSGAGGGSDSVRRARGSVVTVEMEPARVVQTDGEPAGLTPFTAELLAGTLRVMTPRGRRR
jgi:YegS/Rv2252/BmrU family lipid kinase